MSKIGYGYGSEWHLLKYLGYHRAELSNLLLAETGGQRVEWLDFPWTNSSKKFSEEAEYQAIGFLDSLAVTQKWKVFWPQSGTPPTWDAVAKLYTEDNAEWLIIEAKSHIGELNSKCTASSVSKEIILKAFSETQKTFNITNKSPKDWLQHHYQYCNRLAFLHFLLRECNPPIPSRLVFIYFCGESMRNRNCPKNDSEWIATISEMYRKIGIEESLIPRELKDRIHRLFLPINPQSTRK